MPLCFLISKRLSEYVAPTRKNACFFDVPLFVSFARSQMVALCLDDGYWGRMVNVAFLPAIIIFMLFIVHFGITQIVCALGPVAHMQVGYRCGAAAVLSLS